jgi:CRISPR-associated protein Csb2
MRFDVQLTDEERLLLASLVSHLSFLGRAESWVDAELCDSCEDGLDWVTANPSAPATINTRLVRVLSTQRNNDYRRWRDRAIDQAAQTQAASKGKPKLTTAQRRKLEESFPSSLTDCLLTATSTLQAAGWSQPPGSQWIDYLVAQPTRVEIPSKRTSAIYSKRVAAALLSFCSDSVRGRTLPDKSVTVFIGEHLHKACMSKFINLPSHESELATFTGRDCGGDLIEGHRHAHFIPLCIRGDGRYIDHAIVFARDGFGPVAQQSIASVDAIYSAGLPKTHVTLVGFGDLDQVDMEIRAISNGRYKLWTPSRRFRSVTPYVASRHLKLKHDKYTLEANLADECRFRKLPTARITQTPVRNQGRFRIARIGAGRQPPQAEGFQLEIEFDEPLPVNQLPLVLGYGSHFGLGLFEPRHG